MALNPIKLKKINISNNPYSYITTLFFVVTIERISSKPSQTKENQYTILWSQLFAYLWSFGLLPNQTNDFHLPLKHQQLQNFTNRTRDNTHKKLSND